MQLPFAICLHKKRFASFDNLLILNLLRTFMHRKEPPFTLIF